jgi:hypothetical protein
VSDKDQIKPIFLPAGVAGPDKRAGYVADAGGGIEALDLLSGEPIWRSEVTARPLIVKENRLAALRAVAGKANALQVVVLDTEEEGKLLLESEPILFPDWASVELVASESFSYRTGGIKGNDLLLEWEAHGSYRGGASPSAHIQAQATKEANGVARIDLKTGKVKMLNAESRGEIEMPPALQQSIMFSYQMGASDTWETEPWVVDGMIAAITGEIYEEQQALQLQRWNPATAKVEKTVELVKGLALVSYVTPDGCYIFIHSEMPTESSSSAQTPWWLFSVVTGKQLAVLSYEQGTREACVLDSHVYYIVENPPPALRSGGEILQSTMKALDIVSGRLLWQRSLSPQRTKMRPALRQ